MKGKDQTNKQTTQLGKSNDYDEIRKLTINIHRGIRSDIVPMKQEYFLFLKGTFRE